MTAPIYINDEGLELISWKLEVGSWKLLKHQQSRKKKARKAIHCFEKVAELCGDNTDDWYVSKTTIPTSHLYSCFGAELMTLNEVLPSLVDWVNKEVA